eukprot:jgi/Ulvmu1/6244/UM028_0102.1
MFGTTRPVRFGEDSKKENTHRQASMPGSNAATTQRSKPHQPSQDPLCGAEKPERGYVESMDQAFAGQIHDLPLTDNVPPAQKAPQIGKSAGSNNATRQHPRAGTVYFDNEFSLHEFQTLAEFTFGLPRYALTFTNKRLIMEERLRLLGMCGKSVQRTIQYRHIVDVGIGPTNKSHVLAWAAVMCTLALSAYVILRAFGATQPAIAVLMTCLIWAASVVLYAILVDHFLEGDNLKIQTCRGFKDGDRGLHGLFCPATQLHVIRLPAGDARLAMNTLLQHPDVSIWSDRDFV